MTDPHSHSQRITHETARAMIARYEAAASRRHLDRPGSRGGSFDAARLIELAQTPGCNMLHYRHGLTEDGHPTIVFFAAFLHDDGTLTLLEDVRPLNVHMPCPPLCPI